VQQPHKVEPSPDAAFARRLFGTDEPDVDLGTAYESVVARARPNRPRWRSGAAGLAVAAAFAAALLLTPLGGYAMQLLTIFEPKEFVPIAISSKDAAAMRRMPSLASFGTVTSSANRSLRGVASLAAARTTAGFAPRQAGNARSLPPGPVTYFVLPPGTVAFTFSAAKARAYEHRFHRHLPPMPPGLDGTTIRMSLGAGIVSAYGPLAKNLKKVRRAELVDGVAIVQTRAPQITSSGASIATLENYLLSMPDVPADVAAQLRAIADPSDAMPIPFRIDKTSATTVAVDGTHGLAIGDQTGLGSGILWQKGGMVYAIGGSLTASDALALANALR